MLLLRFESVTFPKDAYLAALASCLIVAGDDLARIMRRSGNFVFF